MYVRTKEQFHDAVRRIGNNDPTLTTFHLDYGSAFCKSLDGDDVNRLLAALSKNTHLVELYFDHLVERCFNRNRSGHEYAIMLSEIIVNNNLPLEGLSLYDCIIHDDGGAALAKAIAGNKSLTRLYLDGNEIGDRGAAAFATALEGNCTLETLSLSRGKICNVGAAALSEALAGNTSLKDLHLDGNTIDDRGAATFATALEDNSTLELLSLNNSDVGCDGAIALFNALKKNTNLEYLYLGSNRIGCKAARALSNALGEITTCIYLSLRDNPIKEDGLKAIEGALKVNTRLPYVGLWHNKDHNDACRSIILSIDCMMERNRVLDGHERCIKETDTTFYVCREEGKRRFQWAPPHDELDYVDGYDDGSNEQKPIWQAFAGDGMALQLVKDEFYEILKNDPADVAALKSLIETERNANGDTLLHRAATKDCSAAVDLCLFLTEKVGVDPHRVLNRTGLSVYNVASGSMPILKKIKCARWCRDAKKPDSAEFADALIDIVEEPWGVATALNCLIREMPEVVDPTFWNATVTEEHA